MDLLKELHNLYEAEIPGTGLVEIKDVVENFPTKARKAILALLDKHRLAINGMPIMGENDFLDKLDELLSHEKFPIPCSFDAPYNDDQITLEYEDDEFTPKRDSQMDYLGYDPHTGYMHAGYGVYLDESVFNDEWDKAFENETGEEYDHDNAAHSEAFDHVWEQYKDFKSYLIVAIKVDENGTLSVADHEVGTGRLYPQGHGLMKHQGVVDVILD